MRILIPLLRNGLLSLLAVMSSWPVLATDSIYESFVDPEPQMRPFARWWWNGSRVEAEETIRELDVMRNAGIMGVEINTIGMPDYLAGLGQENHPALEWLGKEWTGVVLKTVDAARQRGMTADIIVGSGWPFGGEFLEPEEQTQRIRLVKVTLDGPMLYRVPLRSVWEDSFLWGVNKKKNRDLRTPTDLKLRFLRLVTDDHGRNGFSAGEEWLDKQDNTGQIVVEIPAGRHMLHIGFHEIGFTEVKRGAPGADGPVVDHYNGKAVKRYLDRMSSTFEAVSGRRMGDLFRATFVDSLELDHANWTTDFPGQFENRRGYPIDPYLPFVLDLEEEGQPLYADFRDVVERARHDFVKTLVELFEERFLATYVKWAEQNGVKARIQAYGREMHPLHGSMIATLPEGETWLWLNRDDDRRIWAQSTVVNKYVSSGAHLSGKRLVSFEAMTNAVPVFRATLDDFKLGMDLSILDGLNHPILHGFNYFPKDIEYPGWVQFGSYLNEVNPFWPHFRKFSDYVGRIGTLLRNSDYQAQVAVLSPRGEEWAKHYMLYQPFPEIIEPWYQYALPQAFQKVGFGVDHVSERVLQGATFVDGELRYGSRGYSILVVQDVAAMDVETAEAILALHKAGGKIVFIGRRPHKAHGLDNHRSRDADVDVIMQKVKGDNVMNLVAPARDVDVLIPGPRGKHLDDSLLIHYADQVRLFSGMNLPVRITNPDPYVSQIHHKLDDGRDVFYFSNRSGQDARTLELRFSGMKGFPVIWDPESGRRHGLECSSGNEVSLHLSPMQSMIIVFEKDRPPAVEPVLPPPGSRKTIEIAFDNKWSVHFQSAADGREFTREFKDLRDLSMIHNDPEVKSFGGTIIYSNSFDYDPGAHYAGPEWISMGNANGTVTLVLNGRELGTSWYGEHCFEIGKVLRDGVNDIKIIVTTVLANDLKARSATSSTKRWAWWYNEIPMGLEGPIHLIRQDTH